MQILLWSSEKDAIKQGLKIAQFRQEKVVDLE